VRFVPTPAELFHPKVYLFEKADGWECIIGSPNFTRGGLSTNTELAVLLTNKDNDSVGAFHRVRSAIDSYWENAQSFTDSQREAYRAIWRRRQATLRSLAGRFGNPDTGEVDDGGQPVHAVSVLALTWPDYFAQVSAEQHPAPNDDCFQRRLHVIRSVRQLFAQHAHFNEIDQGGRRRIAGLTVEGDRIFLWFGNMAPNWSFNNPINDNNADISLALDEIPAQGEVLRHQYLRFMQRFLPAFQRSGIATATRLLAMKRPDRFICVNNQNGDGLCGAFGINWPDVRNTATPEVYWDSIIERIRTSTWWNSAEPPDPGDEQDAWRARVAFLDSLYYQG
jgi:hypothetical protein